MSALKQALTPFPAAAPQTAPVRGGVLLRSPDGQALQSMHWASMRQLQQHGLASLVDVALLPEHGGLPGPALHFSLRPALAEHWVPDHDTRQLCDTLGLDTRHADDLAREILVAMLASPQALAFPSHEEWAAAIRVRQNTVWAARDTRLNPDPNAPRCPAEDWLQDPPQGLRLRPGRSLIAALQTTLQPDRQHPGHHLSSYRASEWVLLLGLAQELQRHHPALYSRLQQRFERRVMRNCEVHQGLMHQLGQPEAALPRHFAVPGDRLWFGHTSATQRLLPDEQGTWSIYLGQGRFQHFLPAVHSPSAPALAGDVAPMREFARWVCPGSSDIELPLA
ncbi:hypothetical protein PSQ39_17995 [Curvibacter sp. HBC28]|uniref:Uncharacterized protein n=1 Tax=Curvibacter microcysteis TaxID=3026419 RepID=A0ABT5MIX4_9BURK|nr:hypothetical protein [Curvibacter sp. HBC28]MDD0816536.1 hypothetical protein [Curvibacter sp. HBC28]